MKLLSPEGRNAVSDISRRYNLSQEAVEHMLIAVNNGGGTMAQFNCPELGGSGQWMRGGMTMVGDMFNNGLKSTVDNLCNELSNLLASTQVFAVAPAGTPGSNQWWPADLGSPISSGSQNNTRYAVFPNRLAVQVNGKVTVYDTLDNNIGGVSQQQGGDESLTFSSQNGTVRVSSLPVVSGGDNNQNSNTNFASAPDSYSNQPASNQSMNQPANSNTDSNSASFEHSSANTQTGQDNNSASGQDSNSASGNEIVALIEKLSQLHGAGVLSDDEFNAKKQELLSRL